APAVVDPPGAHHAKDERDRSGRRLARERALLRGRPDDGGRVPMRRGIITALLALLGAACSAIGSGPGQPEGLPHGGTGPFRLLTAAETMVPPTPSGSTVNDRDRGIENGMAAGGHLFYAAAEPLDLEEPDAGVADA